MPCRWSVTSFAVIVISCSLKRLSQLRFDSICARFELDSNIREKNEHVQFFSILESNRARIKSNRNCDRRLIHACYGDVTSRNRHESPHFHAHYDATRIHTGNITITQSHTHTLPWRHSPSLSLAPQRHAQGDVIRRHRHPSSPQFDFINLLNTRLICISFVSIS
jgi:hypothetical protein